MGRETEMQLRPSERRTLRRDIPNVYERLSGRARGGTEKGTGSSSTPML